MPTQSILTSQKLVAFVPTRDPKRAMSFYRDTLGLRLVNEQLPFALVFDANGTMLRVTIVKDFTPMQFTVLGWEVSDIVATLNALTNAGVVFERYETFMKQNELGIWTSPDGTKVAWFKDPDGNLLSIHA